MLFSRLQEIATYQQDSARWGDVPVENKGGTRPQGVEVSLPGDSIITMIDRVVITWTGPGWCDSRCADQHRSTTATT